MSAREVALQVVRDVFPSSGRERTAQEALDYRVREAKLDVRDRAFTTELAYGAIKMRRTLDWYLQPFLGERAAKLPLTTREILRLAIYELHYTHADAHATLYEFVEMAKRHGHRGLASLVNAVLRNYLREPPLEPERELFETEDEYLGTRHSLPTWLVRQWHSVFGGTMLEEICAGVNRPAQLTVSVDRRRMSVAELAENLRERSIESRPSPLVPESLLVQSGGAALLEESAQGRWWVQSESSAVSVEVLQPQPGERIADLCSGRGNKALQIGCRLDGEGSLCCIDRDSRKMRVLERRFDEHRLHASHVVADVRELEMNERFDRVLLDAPCSGTGVVGRHPEARWKKESGDGERLATTQGMLLDAAARLLYEGGALVYAVCSTDRRECAEVIDTFVRRNKLSRGLIPSQLEPFLTDAGDVLIPPGIDRRDGFYIARLEL